MPGGIANSDGIIHLRGVVRNNKLVALMDHRGDELGGIVVTNDAPITGMLGFLVNGRFVPPAGSINRRAAHIKPLGAAAISATTPVTRHAAMVLPVGFKAYKARIYNAHAAAVTYALGVTTQGALGDAVYNGATWEIPTFSGASSASVPAGSGAVPNQKFGTIDSDIMYTPSVDYNGGTILAVRSYCAVANNTRFDVSSGFLGSLSESGFYSAYVTGADAVTTPSAFTGQTRHASMPPVEIIGYTDEAIKRIALFGSSTLSGSNDTTSQGWAWRAQQSMSSDSMAYLFVNHSQPSALTSSNLTRALLAMPSGAFDEAVYSVYSTNDSDRTSATGMNRLKGQMRVFIDECIKNGIRPVLATFQYPTGMTGQDYINAKIVNNEARTLAAGGYCKLFDVADLFSDESASTGTWKNPANTSDGTHPNGTGTPILAAYAPTVFA